MSRRKRKDTQKASPVDMKTSYLLDIVLLVYGEWGFAENCIAALPEAMEGYNDGYRLTLIDNGTPEFRTNSGTVVTPDEQSKAVRAMLQDTDRFIRLDVNKGYPGGMNEGVRRARAPLILILTPDVTLHKGAIAAMVKEMDDPTVGVVGLKLLFSPDSPHSGNRPGTVQHAGLVIDIGGNPQHIFLGWDSDHPKVNECREITAVTGACFMTRKPLWDAIGGLFEGYGNGTFEDVDYCFAVRARGTKVIYTPHAVGYHYVGASIRAGANQRGFNLGVNGTIFKGRWADKGLAWDEWRYW